MTYVSVEKEMDAIESTNLPGEKRKLPAEYQVNNKTGIKVGNSPKGAHIILEKVSHDHSYCVRSPRRLRRKIDDIVAKAEKVKKKLKISQQKARRLKVRVSTLSTVVSKLEKQNLFSSDCATILETTFSGVTKELMKRLVTQKKKKNVEANPGKLHYFPMTLKFCSAKAYTYVRNLGFPDLSTISKWYNVISGEPGFAQEQLTALKAKVLAGTLGKTPESCLFTDVGWDVHTQACSV